jgi:hypothetical protein
LDCVSGLGGAQLVDLGTEVLEDEIFLGRNLAFVHFLRPLFQRNLDAEFLVDRKDDIEEVEAVDTEVVDRVALRRNRLAVDLTRLSDDVGNFIECSSHARTS